MAAESISEQDKADIQAVTDYIDAHYMEIIPREKLLRIACMSGTRLKTLFKQVTGITIADYLSKCRFAEALRLLTDTEDSVEEIAAKTGFLTPTGFSTFFRRYGGCAPTVFRKRAAALKARYDRGILTREEYLAELGTRGLMLQFEHCPAWIRQPRLSFPDPATFLPEFRAWVVLGYDCIDDAGLGADADPVGKSFTLTDSDGILAHLRITGKEPLKTEGYLYTAMGRVEHYTDESEQELHLWTRADGQIYQLFFRYSRANHDVWNTDPLWADYNHWVRTAGFYF